MVQMAGLQEACPQVIRLPVDKWHTPALANQMVAELLQQSRPGSPGLYATFHGAAATLGPLWPHYGDVSYPAHSRGIGPRFRRDRCDFAGTLAGSVGVVVIMSCGRGRG